MRRRFAGRLLAALTITAAAVAVSVGAAGTVQAGPAPELAFAPGRYALASDGMEIENSEGEEAVYRTGPMEGKLKLGAGEDRAEDFSADMAPFLTMATPAAQAAEAGSPGEVAIKGTGDARVEQVSLLPLRWKLILELDIKIIITNEAGTAVYKSTEPMKLTTTVGSLDPEEFTLKLRNTVRFEATDSSPSEIAPPIDTFGPVFAVVEGVKIAGGPLNGGLGTSSLHRCRPRPVRVRAALVTARTRAE